LWSGVSISLEALANKL